MARIRTIKPEFWTDERLTECSLSARLLFIGMLNFSDDNGNQAYSAKRLKMQIFPADAIDTQPLLDELLAHGVVIEYSVSGEKYLHIKGFAVHQVINRPSATRIPRPSFIADSVSTHAEVTDGREGKGKEGNSEAKASGAKAPMTTDEIIFGYGVPLLTNAGTPEKQARTFLGGLRKQHGDEVLVNTLRDCLKAKPLQPLEWIAAVLPPKGTLKRNKQETLEDENRAVVQRLLAKEAQHASV